MARPTPLHRRYKAVSLTEEQLRWLAEHPGAVNVSAAGREGIARAIRRADQELRHEEKRA